MNPNGLFVARFLHSRNGAETVSTTEPRWATIAAAAAYLAVNERTIRRWITDGTIPGKRIGRKLVRIDLNELDRLGRPLQYIEGGDVA